MDQMTAQQRLDAWDRQGRHVFTLGDLAKVFHEDNPKTLNASLSRLCRHGLLERVVRGIYVYSFSRVPDPYRIERIARAMRRGEYSYVSLESALSEYGVISQVPVDRLTVVTTGRKGTYRTPYGTIEFTHTSRPVTVLVERMREIGRPLRMATPAAAWADLKRVGRNTHLIEAEVLEELFTQDAYPPACSAVPLFPRLAVFPQEEDRHYGPGWAAFCHFNGNGARFIHGTFGAYYTALSEATAIAETQNHTDRFMSESDEPLYRCYSVSTSPTLPASFTICGKTLVDRTLKTR
jgi:hypothetical protein